MGYVLTLISAVCYYFSFPPYTQGYLAFISLAPFFLALSKSGSIKKTFVLGSMWGLSLSVLFSVPLFHALINEYNLNIIFSALLIFISVYIPYCIIYGLYGITLIHLFNRKSIYLPFIAASLWILIDYIMSVVPLLMPWGYAGYTQTFNIFIQISDLTGIYGVSFLVVLINSMLALFLYWRRNFLSQLILLLLLLIAPAIYGNLRLNNIVQRIDFNNQPFIKTAIIQGNFKSNEKWDSNNTTAIINTYVSLTKQILDEADMIIWPETVLNSSDAVNVEILSGVSLLLNPDQIFITGATRNDKKNNFYNSIFTVERNKLNYIYDKIKLFPFTETSLAGFSAGRFMDSPAIFSIGKNRPVYKSGLAILGYTICFEAIYPDSVRKIKKSGAEILINVANDSWFGNTYQPFMHLYSNIVRAVENRVYVIRASNNGISAAITPTGKVINSIPLNTRDKILTPVKAINIASFYSTSGDWFIVFALLVIITSLAYRLKINK
jgi:apolipoprotein N-acyltransferase